MTTDFRQTPDRHPWACDLNGGDLVTAEQAGLVNRYRLAQFGLELSYRRNRHDYRVIRRRRGVIYYDQSVSKGE
jgi:hypothetical protein